MNRTMITATNTLSQLQKQMDIASDNLANLGTTGFKRKQSSFSELLVQQFNNQPSAGAEAGRLTPLGIRQGVGAQLAQSQIVMTQGSLKSTDRPLDFALTSEKQYFRVLEQSDNGSAVRFTRDGAFYLTPTGQNENMLVTSAGHPVLDANNNPITVSADASNYKLMDDGSLAVQLNNGATQEIDLGISLVKKPQFLEQMGGNLLGMPNNLAELNVTADEIYTDLNGPLRTQIAVSQGMLEQSNVDMSKEMTDIINLQRSYQFQSRSISMADQMMGLINGIR
ncbi:flagellar hook-basal body protein [Cytobacillus purgationiresistens]|uniref:Flagellar basal-body rod protein FlgG n=1 Tax=Cytobacillus purgationiresistens TaxID=863449 RepID=A0ABU0AD94_9BACI|nr:flagellar hook-basal body protein [Cytobacillus purgationiresistens]MDQ0269231.1 flagellar basal-body rod protein FlgG [Cytobacillus purgationiresistens]